MIDDIEMVELGGLRWIVRKGSSDIKALQEVVEERSYERRDFPIEGKGERWLDMGANIGAFACMVGARGADVIAYEPDPDSFSLLQENIALNRLGDRVKAHQAAVVAGSEKVVALHVNGARKNYWRNSIHKSWRGGTTIHVPAVPIAGVVELGRYVKMDIEGAEMPILEALEKRPGDRLVFEWSFDIDRSVPRFRNAIARLRTWYERVTYAKFDESVAEWHSSWFPPCRTVWCR